MAFNVAPKARRREDGDLEANPTSPAFQPRPSLGWRIVSSPLLHDSVAAAACLILALALEKAKPRSRFVLMETLYEHSYPKKPNTVPSWTVPVYSLLGPLALFLVYHLARPRRLPRWEAGRLVAGLCLAFFLTGAITNCLKLPVGRLRPNFVRTCWPNGTMAFLPGNDTWGGYAVCDSSVDAGDAEEIRKSWPSGHSSMSAAGLGFTSWFILGQLRAFSHSAVEGRLWRLTLALLPSFGAVAVGITRVLDYWHFPSDVMTGLAIGFLASFFVYRLLYPPLTHPRCEASWEALAAAEGRERPQSPSRQDLRIPGSEE